MTKETNQSQNPAIVSRVQFEAWGTAATPHSPGWGNEVLAETEGSLDHFVRNRDEATKLAELTENTLFEKLASRWATPAIDQQIEGRRWGAYATSGSETNGKEALQLLSLVQEVTIHHPDNAAGLYFIDTASHSMRDQLQTEAEMYACKSGQNPEEVRKAYLDLFRGRVRHQYIEPLIAKLDIDHSKQEDIRKVWERRSLEFDVPADAIDLPDREAYIAFCKNVGMHDEVVAAIHRAFEFVESRDDIPQTLGSLRCAIFTETSALLSTKLGMESPIVAAPFDEAAMAAGWGNLTMRQMQGFVSETYEGRPIAFYNMLDPETGKETAQFNREGKVQRRALDPRYEKLRYEDVKAHGHFSGMGYYTFLMTAGQGSFAFVLDNYEAGGPHERTIQAEIEGRFQSDVVMVGLPRGWARLASFEGTEDSTYGASPALEILVSEALKDDKGISTIDKYTGLIRNNVGENTTIALDVSKDGSTLWVIPNNRILADTHHRGSGIDVTVSQIDYENAQNVTTLVDKIDKTSSISEIIRVAAELGLGIDEETLREYEIKEGALKNVILQAEESSRQFIDQYTLHMKIYHINRQRAVAYAFSLAGGSYTSDKTGTRTLTGPMESERDIYEMQLNQAISLETVDATTEQMYVRARKLIEEQDQTPKINEHSPHYETYARADEASLHAQTYINALTAEKVLKSLVKAQTNNPDRFTEALKAWKDDIEPTHPAVVNLLQALKILRAIGYVESVDVFDFQPDILSQLVSKSEADKQSNASTLVENFGCAVGTEGQVKQSEAERILKIASATKRTILSFAETQYEAELLRILSEMAPDATISEISARCLAFCCEKAPEISDTMKGKSEGTGKHHFSGPDVALDYVAKYARLAKQIHDFKTAIKEEWTRLNHQSGQEFQIFLDAHDRHKRDIMPIAAMRNSLEAELDQLRPTAQNILTEVHDRIRRTIFVIN